MMGEWDWLGRKGSLGGDKRMEGRENNHSALLISVILPTF